MFLYQKTVDRSTLRQGFQIPVEYHALLAAMPGGMLSQGETRNIKVWIDNVEYDAQLKNQGFDRNKYGDHADVVQVRYGENSPIAKKLGRNSGRHGNMLKHQKLFLRTSIERSL